MTKMYEATCEDCGEKRLINCNPEKPYAPKRCKSCNLKKANRALSATMGRRHWPRSGK